ncbi:14052_t:CDS:1, partial [Dentiscutata heterogama]
KKKEKTEPNDLLVKANLSDKVQKKVLAKELQKQENKRPNNDKHKILSGRVEGYCNNGNSDKKRYKKDTFNNHEITDNSEDLLDNI